jgi:GDP-4-dehydro-6-deoxy-D-mannose reductase
MTRVLITGGGGFVGQWLARALLARGDDVFLAGLGRLDSGPAILANDERKRVQWIHADMRNTADVDAMIERSRADRIMHLAGVAFPPAADKDPTAAYDVNALGVVRLLASVDKRRNAGTADPTILVVGSGTQYGAHGFAEMPLTEDAVQRPAGVYAASKSAQETFALAQARSTGIKVVCTRSFNHSGIGHGKEYLLPSLVEKVRKVRDELAPTIAIGNDVVRDYLHVSDVVAAYIALAERGRTGEAYNVASGTGISVRDLATDVLLRAGLAPDISSDPSLIRATDIPVLVGSPAKLQRDTGWTPRKTHADIIDDLLNAATD